MISLDRVARRRLHAVAARRQAAQGAGARLRHRQPQERARAGRAAAQHSSSRRRAREALCLSPQLAHPSRALRRASSSARAARPATISLLTITAATAKPMQLRFDRLPSAGALRRAIDGAVKAEDWFDDVHGSAAYKRHLTYYFAEQIRAELASSMNLTVNGKRLSAEPAPGQCLQDLPARARMVRRQEGLRPGRLRRLHRVAGRRAVPQLPAAGFSRRRPRRHHHRGPGAGRRAAPDAAGLSRRASLSMRLLRRRHDHDRRDLRRSRRAKTCRAC